jgi:hypothetical protein
MGTLVAYQGVLDTPMYQNFWEDSKVLPPTHDEMDAIWFSDDTVTAADMLDKPLGKHAEEVKVVKSVTFTEANRGR